VVFLDVTSPSTGVCTTPPHAAAQVNFKNNHFTEMCCGTEAGSYLRLIDSCITQLKAQGRSRTCNESKEEEEGVVVFLDVTSPSTGVCTTPPHAAAQVPT